MNPKRRFVWCPRCWGYRWMEVWMVNWIPGKTVLLCGCGHKVSVGT